MTNLDVVLATIGLNDTKPSKADAHATLREIIDNMPPEMLEHHSTAKALGGLYMYFLPPVGKSITDPFEWVARAASTDPSSPDLMRMVQVRNGRLMASDGHRLHVARKDGLEDGAYSPATKSRVGDADRGYIDKLLILAGNREHTYQHSARSTYPIDRSGKHHLVDIHGHFIQLAFYRDAMRMGRAEWVRTPGNKGAVRFDFEEGRMALIMPFKTEEQ